MLLQSYYIIGLNAVSHQCCKGAVIGLNFLLLSASGQGAFICINENKSYNTVETKQTKIHSEVFLQKFRKSFLPHEVHWIYSFKLEKK
jgi:hypothetical protein